MQELMKKIVYAIAALALIFTGCAKELDNSTKDNFSKVRLHVKVADQLTKVSADNDGRYHWQAGDKITVFNDAEAPFEFSTEKGGSDIDFGTYDPSWIGNLGKYAMYPASDYHVVSGNEIVFNLPSSIAWAENSTNMPMLGKISGDVATFKAVGGVLKLVCYNIPSGAAKLWFVSSSSRITGDFEIADASVANPVIASEPATDDVLEFTFAYSSNKVFYIPLPTGEIDGFEVQFLDGSDTELFSKSTDATFSVGRNKMIIAPALDCTGVPDALLTNAEIIADVPTSYDEGTINSASGDWDYSKALRATTSGTIRMQIAASEYLKLPSFSTNIQTITLHNTGNGGGSGYSGTVYFSEDAANSSEIASTVHSGALGTDVVITVPSGYTTGYIIPSGAFRFHSITVSFVQSGSFPSLTATDDDLEIAVGSLTATTTVSLSNPVDALGISCVVNDAAKYWLSASISGSTLTVTAAEANSTAADRDGTVTLKATGAANVVISVTQPTKMVANPTVTATAGDSKFTATWAAVPHATSYVAYLHTAPTATPATGGTNITASISESAGTYSITDYAVANDTHYYLYVKVNEVESNYEAVSDYIVKDFTPAEAKGTLENPYWASEAYDYISTFGSGEGPDDPIYVKGYVSTASNPASNSQTYYISDDGTTTKEFEAYKGKGISGANITASNRVNVGDYVVVSGLAYHYNGTTPEFKTGSTIITHNPKLAAPTFSVAEGTYYATQTVSLSAADGATIYYTIDGSEPISSSSVYSAPLSISTNTTVKAFAVKADCVDSAVASATYTIEAPTQLVMSTITCSAQTGSSLTFTWTAVTNATGYQVSLDGGTNWESKQAGLSYTWTGLDELTTYTIKVKAIGTANGQYTDSEPGSANGTTLEAGSAPSAGTVMWAETWSGATTTTSANDSSTPSANYGHGTTVYNDGDVTYTQSANSVYVRNEELAGGSKPELMLTSGKTWTIANIPTGGATKLTLTYLSNNTKSSVTCSTKGASISGSSKSYTITTGGADTITLVFGCSGNTRIDNVSLVVAAEE